MQLYEGLPTITNKVSSDDQRGVPHHLLGCVKLEQEPWAVDVYTRNASAVVLDTPVEIREIAAECRDGVDPRNPL